VRSVRNPLNVIQRFVSLIICMVVCGAAAGLTLGPQQPTETPARWSMLRMLEWAPCQQTKRGVGCDRATSSASKQLGV